MDGVKDFHQMILTVPDMRRLHVKQPFQWLYHLTNRIGHLDGIIY